MGPSPSLQVWPNIKKEIKGKEKYDVEVVMTWQKMWQLSSIPEINFKLNEITRSP